MSTNALLIIDMQNALVAGAYDEDGVLGRTQDVIAECRAAHIPIIYVQHNHASYEPMKKGENGWEIHPSIAPQDGDLLVEKEASDAFYGTNLMTILEDLDVSTLLIGGMQTEFCVDTTVRAALSHGYDVVLLIDCHTTGDAELPAADIIRHHNYTLSNVAHPSAIVHTVASKDVQSILDSARP